MPSPVVLCRATGSRASDLLALTFKSIVLVTLSESDVNQAIFKIDVGRIKTNGRGGIFSSSFLCSLLLGLIIVSYL
jgi:hypothetical protein